MRHDHDCTRCQALGQFGQFDLYYCETGGLPDTVIARYGNEPSEYTSGVALAGLDPALGEAVRRAQYAGIQIQASVPSPLASGPPWNLSGPAEDPIPTPSDPGKTLEQPVDHSHAGETPAAEFYIQPDGCWWEGITRFEVINATVPAIGDKIMLGPSGGNGGRVYGLRSRTAVVVEASLQDGGRTLKIFLREP